MSIVSTVAARPWSRWQGSRRKGARGSGCAGASLSGALRTPPRPCSRAGGRGSGLHGLRAQQARSCEDVGIESFAHDLPVATGEAEFFARGDAQSRSAHRRILMQMPCRRALMPAASSMPSIRRRMWTGCIPPMRDFCSSGGRGCAPARRAVAWAPRRSEVRSGGKICGRHRTQHSRRQAHGAPLLEANATVTIAHSRTAIWLPPCAVRHRGRRRRPCPHDQGRMDQAGACARRRH